MAGASPSAVVWDGLVRHWHPDCSNQDQPGNEL